MQTEKDIEFNQRFPDSLQRELVTKAQGVILWLRFAVDEVIRQVSNKGLKSTEISEFVNNMPHELEDIYSRILKSIPAEKRNQAAVFLFLVQAFEDSEYSMDLVWGAFGILRRKISNCVPDVSSKRDLEDYMKRLLPGLLDIFQFENKRIRPTEIPAFAAFAKSIGVEELPSTVRYVHKTLRSYLHKQDWISQNIPSAFKYKFPTNFHFQLYAQVIEQAI